MTILKDKDHPSTTSSGFRLSLVIPAYNEEDTVRPFMERVVPIVEGVTPDYELIWVNDGSTDRTVALLKEMRRTNVRIKIVDLTRNFGKERALTAGIDHATGDAIMPLDADLQDPPDLIPAMVEKWRQGYDMVVAVRTDRQSDTVLKRTLAQLFYRMFDRLSDVPMPPDAGDFRLMDRRVVEALKRMPERTRFMKGLFAWLGFRQTAVTYVRPARIAGETKWKYWQLWNLTLEGIFSFTTFPLRVWTYFGLLVAIAAFMYMLFIVARTVIYGVSVPGYASLAAILLFFSGINMIGLGILGEYLGRVFIEVKQRPLYLVRKVIGFDLIEPSKNSGKECTEVEDTQPRRSA
jgi:polyisoprenyl-phosphate glycosyltransferase